MNKLKTILDIAYFICFIVMLFQTFKIIKRAKSFNKKEFSMKINTKLSKSSVFIYILSIYGGIKIVEGIVTTSYIHNFAFRLTFLVWAIIDYCFSRNILVSESGLLYSFDYFKWSEIRQVDIYDDKLVINSKDDEIKNIRLKDNLNKDKLIDIFSKYSIVNG
ncbi:hypothetical protein [Clostridium sp. Marseille-Q2269]|uniref:hypothetical protein n=1 Tax=Clostridium sp. Marseille-Q2269 TaxID=2942205 RepID=UPI002073975D|nr:hypothetical protein [Clostridium sp. Marseille-Q2269]